MFTRFRRTKGAECPSQRIAASCKPRLEALEDRSVPASFTDSFEGSSLDPFWTKIEVSGFVTMPSTEEVHTGSQSVQFTSTNTSVDKNAGLRHNFDEPTFGRVSVWVFDTGAGEASSNQLWFSISNTIAGGGALLAGADYGIADGVAYYWDAGGESAHIIQRTREWHQFSIDSQPTGLTLQIDGQTVYSDSTATPFNRVTLQMPAPYWRPAWTSYWDDFEFQDASPAPSDIAISSSQWLSPTQTQFSYQTTGNPGPFAVGLYRSADPVFDAGDLAIGGPMVVTPSAPNQGGTETLTVSDPNDPMWLDPARPYVLVVADPANAIGESDEANNAAVFAPPPYATPGDLFTNVALPEVRLALPVVEEAALELQFAPLGLNFTAQTVSEPGALAAVQSNIGTLSMSVASQTFGYSTGQSTLTVFGGAAPHIRWETANFHFSPAPPAPDLDLYNTGPLTMDVSLADLGLTLATPFETTVRTAEAYFHTLLSHNLRDISPLFSQLLVIEDPGETDLLTTDNSGRQTGRRADGALVSGIPFSIYAPNVPLVLVFAPQAGGTYETEVRGLVSGDYTLVTATVANLTSTTSVQSFSGTLAKGATEVYSTQVGSDGDSTNTAADPDSTLETLERYVYRLFETGEITNRGVANSLVQKLRQAQQQLDRGDNAAARSTLGSFINQVSAQRNKHVSAAAAESLTDLAQFVLGSLPHRRHHGLRCHR